MKITKKEREEIASRIVAKIKRDYKRPLIGVRVELSPSHDLWMRGAKFGKIHSVIDAKTVRVRMDNTRVRKLQRVRVEDLSSFLTTNLDVYTTGKTPVLIMTVPSGTRVYFRGLLNGKGSTLIEASAHPAPDKAVFWVEAISLEKEVM